MKKEYPVYRRKGISFVKDLLSEKDAKTLEDFKEYVGITAGDMKIEMIQRHILQLYDVTEVSFDRITLDILRKFLFLLNRSDRSIETKNDTKKAVKRFLKWRYKDWSERFEELRDIKISDGTNHQKLNASTILTTDELQMIVSSVDSLKYKALILLMFESAGRPEEILKLRWKDIDLDRGEVTLHSSKTRRTRVNPISESIGHLRRYREECFYPPARASDLLFPSSNDRNRPITRLGLYGFFVKTERTLNLTKHIFPYLLRHTRLTQVHKKLSPKAYEKFAGHSIEVGTKRYAHLDNEDVRQEMLKKVYKVEEVTHQEKAKIRELESRLRKLEGAIHIIIEKANLVYDATALPK